MGCELLRLARGSIHAALTDEPFEPVTEASILDEHHGVFVSLYHQGKLRGCIGQVEPKQALRVALCKMAVAAATTDPRFPRLTLDQLEQTVIEISLLTPLTPCPAPRSDLIIGLHGVVVRSGGRSGVFLPKVAPRLGWDVAELLRQASVKAALSEDAWDSGEVLRFEATVIID